MDEKINRGTKFFVPDVPELKRQNVPDVPELKRQNVPDVPKLKRQDVPDVPDVPDVNKDGQKEVARKSLREAKTALDGKKKRPV